MAIGEPSRSPIPNTDQPPAGPINAGSRRMAAPTRFSTVDPICGDTEPEGWMKGQFPFGATHLAKSQYRYRCEIGENVCSFASFSPNGEYIVYRKTIHKAGLSWDI
jgi:hypothetical protein